MPASKKIPLTVRRTRLAKVRAKAIEKVKDKIRPVFRRQFRRLESFLRARNRGGNLRNRIGKIELPTYQVDGDKIVFSKAPYGDMEAVYQLPISPASGSNVEVKIDESLYKVKYFFKANAQSQQDWDVWKKTLVAALILALLGIVTDFGDEENDIWQTRGYDPVDFNSQQIVDALRARVGEAYFSGLADTTFDGVEQKVTDWNSGDQPIGDLISSLDQYFNDNRIDTIASTTAGAAESAVVYTEMLARGWKYFYWDAMMEDTDNPPCDFCQNMHGQKLLVSEGMPPDASHENCRCEAIPIEESEDDNG